MGNALAKIFESASKIVFIMLAITACAGFFLGKLQPDQFMILAGMAFGFYFANKGDADQPYLGK